MPLVTVTVRKPKSEEFKSAVLAGVHRALVNAGVPEKDRFQRVLELDAADFRYDGEYPDLSASRTEDFVLIEILLSVGRRAHAVSRTRSRQRDGLLQGNGVGELGLRRRPHPARLTYELAWRSSRRSSGPSCRSTTSTGIIIAATR
jgi:Tautomerase enzyme